jgi:hypothetical protein
MNEDEINFRILVLESLRNLDNSSAIETKTYLEISKELDRLKDAKKALEKPKKYIVEVLYCGEPSYESISGFKNRDHALACANKLVNLDTVANVRVFTRNDGEEPRFLTHVRQVEKTEYYVEYKEDEPELLYKIRYKRFDEDFSRMCLTHNDKGLTLEYANDLMNRDYIQSVKIMASQDDGSTWADVPIKTICKGVYTMRYSDEEAKS